MGNNSGSSSTVLIEVLAVKELVFEDKISCIWLSILMSSFLLIIALNKEDACGISLRIVDFSNPLTSEKCSSPATACITGCVVGSSLVSSGITETFSIISSTAMLTGSAVSGSTAGASTTLSTSAATLKG